MPVKSSTRFLSGGFPFGLFRQTIAPGRARNAAQQNVGELARGVFVRNLEQASFAIPQIVVERVMNHHADKRAHYDQGFNLDHRPVALSLTNVLSEKRVHAT